MSMNVRRSGPATSSISRLGAPGRKAATTAAARSAMATGRNTWSPPITGITPGMAASARIRPVPPYAARAITSDGRNTNQSPDNAFINASVPALERAYAVPAASSAPTADR